MNTLPRSESVSATDVEISDADATIKIHLADGRTLTVPLLWFPRLRAASPEQRRHWRFIGGGTGIHWPDIDEDLSVRSMLIESGPTERPSPSVAKPLP